MSFNISGAVIQQCKSLTGLLSTGGFGPRQIAAFKRGVKTGNIRSGNSLPSIFAKLLRAKEGMPWFVTGTGDSGGLEWGNMAERNDFFESLTACVVASRLGRNPVDAWKNSYLSRVDEDIKIKSSRGHLFHIDCRPLNAMDSLPLWEGEIPTEFEVDMLNNRL